MSKRDGSGLPGSKGAPHHVRPRSRGGTGKYEDLFYWPGVAKNRISHKHTAFHQLGHNATLLEVVQRFPTIEDKRGGLNARALTSSLDKSAALAAWAKLYGASDVAPWAALEQLVGWLGRDRFRFQLTDQLDGRNISEFLAREEEYLRYFLLPPNGVERDTEPQPSPDVYHFWRRIVGPATFFQGALMLVALERKDHSLNLDFLTYTKSGGGRRKDQFMLEAWAYLFGSREANPDFLRYRSGGSGKKKREESRFMLEARAYLNGYSAPNAWEAAVCLGELFGRQRLRRQILWQLDGRSVKSFLNRQKEYFDYLLSS